jgi:hypothetical protein
VQTKRSIYDFSGFRAWPAGLRRERVEKVDGSPADNLEVDLSHDDLPMWRGEAAYAVEEG